MFVGNKKIIVLILSIVLFVSFFCMINIVFADETITITTANNCDSNINLSKSYVGSEEYSVINISVNDTLYSEYPTLTVKGKPSCQSCYKKYKYKWFTREWMDYCPHCRKYNSLRVNPKRVYEVELTCKYCDSDYCVVCGHDKTSNYYKHSKYYLRNV